MGQPLAVVVTVVVIALLVAYAIGVVIRFNQLSLVRGLAAESWRQLELSLRERHELVAPYIRAVAGAHGDAAPGQDSSSDFGECASSDSTQAPVTDSTQDVSTDLTAGLADALGECEAVFATDTTELLSPTRDGHDRRAQARKARWMRECTPTLADAEVRLGSEIQTAWQPGLGNAPAQPAGAMACARRADDLFDQLQRCAARISTAGRVFRQTVRAHDAKRTGLFALPLRLHFPALTPDSRTPGRTPGQTPEVASTAEGPAPVAGGDDAAVGAVAGEAVHTEVATTSPAGHDARGHAGESS